MEHTDDPTKVFEKYAEGVVVHDDKSITISTDVQRDILNATAGLMHEQRKVTMILTVVLGMLMESEDHNATIQHLTEMLSTYFENPGEVHLFEAESPDEVKDIINSLDMLSADEEVQN